MEIPKPFNFRLRGRAKEVFKMLELLATTFPEERLNPKPAREIVTLIESANMAVPAELLKEIFEGGKILWTR